MRLPSGGSILVFVFCVTLMGVCFVSTFGVPELPFRLVMASAPDESLEDDFSLELNRAEVGESKAYQADDLFAPVRDDGGPAPPSGSAGLSGATASDAAGSDAAGPWDDPFDSVESAPSEANLAAVANPDTRPVASSPRSISGFADEPSTEPLPQNRASTRFTWRQAVRRLNALGIHDYQLRPGADPMTFHFSCVYRPQDDARVIHLFESEAQEPLQAVRQVVAQAEAWGRTQSPAPGHE